MKKLIIAILAALLASGAFAQDSFPDIPEGHWAGDAVDRIADLNIVIGFPDGTFRGNEAFTRYQAALVVSRLLDVIAENVDAALAMTNEDIASLRNAVQELSSDVAAQGTRLSAAEGAIAGLSDDFTNQNARLDDLESALANMDTEIDPDVLRDLQNQIAAQRVATDTAQATADQALARANAAGSLAEANAAEIAALNELIQLLGDQIAALEGVEIEGFDSTDLESRIARNEGDIANIREFVILLRRDQVALRDRVSALEASDEQQSADIADLQNRVTAIEDNPLGLSGSITVEYFVGRYTGEGDLFDVDRAYGVGMRRSMGPSVFSSGTEDVDDDDDEDEVGERAQDRADITYGSDFDADIDVTLGSGSTFDSVGGLNSFEATAIFTLERDTGYLGDEDGSGDVSPDDFGEEEEYVLSLDEFTATFDPIGGEDLSFAFGEEVSAFFTPYTLNHEDTGFVATLGSPDFLSFLDPTLQIAYLTGDYDESPEGYIVTGARLEVAPLESVSLGVTYVRNSFNVDESSEVTADDVDGTIFGVDLGASLGPVAILAEYANATIDDIGGGDAYSDDVLFVTADATFDILGGVEFAANFRDIAAGWGTALSNPVDPADPVSITDADDYPFEEDQSGFGIEAGLGIFIFDVDVFFDSYATTVPDASTTAFGVDTEVELFRAVGLTAFYESVSIDGDVVDDNDATERDNVASDHLDGEYRTGFGVGIEHAGAAEDALVPNLDLELRFERLGAEFDTTHIVADASYDLSVSIVNLTPYVHYESTVDDDAVDGGGNDDDVVEMAVGTGLTTEPLDIFLAPSLEAAVNYRTAAHTEVVGEADYTTTEMQWSVGLDLNEFLLENSVFTARYGSYTGTNVAEADLDGEGATDISDGDAPTGSTQSVSGYELIWDYYGLEFSYGVYAHDPDTDLADNETTAQAFGVSYSVEF